MRRFLVRLVVGGMVALVGSPGSLSAQGFSVNEHSTCAMGRAGTAVAEPCADGSAMVYNPGGLAGLGRGHGVIAIGTTFIAPGGSYTDDLTGAKDDLQHKVIPVPALYAAYGLSDRLGAGIAVFAPYGLETNWDTDAQGRFLGYKSVIRNIYVQPTLSFRVHPRIDVGAGFDVNFSHVQLRQHVDLSSQSVPPGLFPPNVQTFADVGILTSTDFADANLRANATGVGYHLGLILRPVDRLALGVRYLSRQKIKYNDGEVEFTQINTNILLGGQPLDAQLAGQFQAGQLLADQGAKTAIRLPEQLTFGAAVDVTSKFKAMVDATTTNWKVFQSLLLDFDLAPTVTLPQNFKRTWAWRFGAQYAVSPTATLRAGFITHGAASPKQTVTPNLPEGKRSEFTAGFGTRLGRKVHVDLAYQYIDQADRRGRVVSDPAVTTGLFGFNAHLFGATLSYAF